MAERVLRCRFISRSACRAGSGRSPRVSRHAGFDMLGVLDDGCTGALRYAYKLVRLFFGGPIPRGMDHTQDDDAFASRDRPQLIGNYVGESGEGLFISASYSPWPTGCKFAKFRACILDGVHDPFGRIGVVLCDLTQNFQIILMCLLRPKNRPHPRGVFLRLASAMTFRRRPDRAG